MHPGPRGIAALICWLALGLAACGDGDKSDDTGSSGEAGACELADANQACPECYDGEVTCTYGDVSVTEGSCGDGSPCVGGRKRSR